MLEHAQELDRWLMLRVNRDWAGALSDHLFPTLSSFAAWTPLLLLAALIAAWRGGFRVRAFLVCATAAALLSEALIGGPLKKMVGRVRPHETMREVVKRTLPGARPALLALFREPELEPGRDLRPGARGRSFPSSHTVNMFAVAAVALAFFGWRAWIFPLVAALVAWSRVYCGVHWTSDVLGSAPLGLLAGLGTVRLAEFLWARYGGRWFAAAHARHPRLRDQRP